MPTVMKQMNLVSRCMTLYRGEQLSTLKPKHHSFVFVICGTPGLSQDQIARRLCINKSTVARSLEHLEKQGLISRTPAPDDKRVTLVYPTEAMLELLPLVRAIAKQWNELITEECSAEELEIFLSVLSRITQRATQLVNVDEGGGKR